MPYVALRSHVVETRLEWHTQPIYLSNEHSVALQFWMIVQVGGGSLNAKVKIASVEMIPFLQLSMPSSSQWACQLWTYGIGSSC